MMVMAKATNTPTLPSKSQTTANNKKPVILAMISTMGSMITHERGKI